MRLIRLLKRVAIVVAVVAISLLGLRAWDAQRGEPLRSWHTWTPPELSVDQMDHADWQQYLAAEEKIFEEMRTEVVRKLGDEDRVPVNRYFEDSPVYPGHFAEDWNRSYVMEPDGPPRGAVVFLHGLTDSPYSLRHLARRFRDLGYVSVAPRIPGHGTVPAGLTVVGWEDWMAATRLAVREARRRAGPSAPLHLVGFSNGGALALLYALDALDDPSLPKPDRLVLISPMVGITAFARFVGLAALPAVFPAFARAAWVAILPEFNPFKYNSFPVKAARQSYLLTDHLQQSIVDHARRNGLADLPPTITFQSVVDFTVSTRAIINALYAHLPANGHELVLFDLNRSNKLGPLLRAANQVSPERLLPAPPRTYRTTLLVNAGTDTRAVVERVVEAGESEERTRPLGLDYPLGVFSLSHVALPFPLDDSLYGMDPPAGEPEFGVNLGSVAARGERGALIVSLDALLRMSSNPFFPYLSDRVMEFTATVPPPAAQAAGG